MTGLSRYSILQNVRPSDVRRDPFPHIVVEPCLPDDLYAELAAAYPTDELILGLGAERRRGPVRPNSRHDVGAYQLLNELQLFSKAWLAFAAYHTSPDFFAELLALLGPDIKALHPTLEARLGRPLEACATGLRYAPGWRQSQVALDCHIGINTPSGRRHSVRGGHTDAPDELFAALLYFRRPDDRAAGGDLEILRWRSDRAPVFVGSEVDAADTEPMMTIPYRPNTAVIFVNSDCSLHAVSARGPSSTSRRLVNVMGRVPHSIPEGLFRKRQKPGVLALARRAWLRWRIATGRF